MRNSLCGRYKFIVTTPELAKLTCEGSESLEDLKDLAARGVEILTCGTCLNFYGITEKLQIGSVTNMYDIVERMSSADRVIKP